jgi:hypothetical protein
MPATARVSELLGDGDEIAQRAHAGSSPISTLSEAARPLQAGQ